MIMGSGTFVVEGMVLTTVGDDAVWVPGGLLPSSGWTAAGISGNMKSGHWAFIFFTGMSTLTLVGYAGGVYDVEAAPPGFTPTTNLKGTPATQHNFVAPGGGESVSAIFGDASSSFSGGPDSGPVQLPDAVFTDNETYSNLIGLGLSVTAVIVGIPFTFGSNAETHGGGSGPSIHGNYDIVYYWWLLPDKDACGNEHESHLVLALEKPGDNFERLDPADPDAAPTPIILNVEPNHGRAGTRVAIIGSGFGDGANVQFDGIDAVDIDVVSQYRVEATAPAHGDGFANVAVINVDGVSS